MIQYKFEMVGSVSWNSRERCISALDIGTEFGCSIHMEKNNGTAKGKRYFKCDDNHGVFVRRDNIFVANRPGAESESSIDIDSSSVNFSPEVPSNFLTLEIRPCGSCSRSRPPRETSEPPAFVPRSRHNSSDPKSSVVRKFLSLRPQRPRNITTP